MTLAIEGTSFFSVDKTIPLAVLFSFSSFFSFSLFFDPHNQATSNLIPLDTESASPISASKIDMDVPP